MISINSEFLTQIICFSVFAQMTVDRTHLSSLKFKFLSTAAGVKPLKLLVTRCFSFSPALCQLRLMDPVLYFSCFLDLNLARVFGFSYPTKLLFLFSFRATLDPQCQY